jgi:pantetheine-phosphate adenylyltransferase
MERSAVYPGSFDPVTRGHLDIIRRARRLFDRVIVAVSVNPDKKATFSVDERLSMLDACTRGMRGVQVDALSGLLVDYLRRRGSHVVIRGLRVVSDLDYEFQLASFNRKLYPRIETIFFMPDDRYTHLSSSIVKSAAILGARVDGVLPPAASEMLRKKFRPARSAKAP